MRNLKNVGEDALDVQLIFSNFVNQAEGESEIEILLYALDEYRTSKYQLLERNRADADDEVSEYQETLQTIKKINDLITDVSISLCLGDQTRIENLRMSLVRQQAA